MSKYRSRLSDEKWILMFVFVALVLSVSMHKADAVSVDKPDAGPREAVTDGPFLPPIPSQPWTRSPILDVNGNGMPDPGDNGANVTRSGPSLTLSVTGFPTKFSGQTSATLSNPQPGTLRFLTATTRYTDSFGGVHTITANFKNLDAGGRPTLIELNENGSTPYVPPSKGPAHVHMGPKAYLINVIDADKNGIYEAFTFEGTNQPKATINFVTVDVNNDGKGDFVTIPWSLASAIGVQAKNRIPQVFIPVGDTDLDGIPDAPALDLDRDGFPDRDLLAAPGLTAPAGKIAVGGGDQKLYFAQFGNGSTNKAPLAGLQVFSQIMLINQSTEATTASVAVRDDLGRALFTTLNGEATSGNKNVIIPAGGLRVLKTDGLGTVTSGSVTVSSDKTLAGVILFGGSFGLAGVGSSLPLSGGFLAPMETNTAGGINTGIAMLNLETAPLTATLQLADTEGRVFSTARLDGANAIAAGGHLSKFLSEFNWVPALDFSNLQAVLRVTTNGRVAATVVQTRPGEFATMPVSPLVGDALSTQLNFAHFGTGIVTGTQKIISQIVLIGLSNIENQATLTVRDDAGLPMTVDLNGETINGTKDIMLPAGGLRSLKTSGNGPLKAGSVQVTATRPMAGVIIFAGDFGAAGVGSSVGLSSGFSAPVENNDSLGISTGIAIQNLETADMVADLELFSTEGQRIATGRIDGDLTVKAGGHLARFVPQFRWTPVVNFANFTGVIKVKPNGRAAATVIQTRPLQFATMPVAPN